MILKILITSTIVIAVLMYLVILGASKNKTAGEIEQEDKEQIEQLKKYCRRQKNDK